MVLADITNAGVSAAPTGVKMALTTAVVPAREVTPPPEQVGGSEWMCEKIFSPVSLSGKARDKSVDGDGREQLVGRDFPVVAGMRVRLTEDEQEEFADQSGRGAGIVSSVDPDGRSCRVLWDATGVECAYPTGECNFFFLRREGPSDPTHGLGEAQFAQPSLMIHKAAACEPVSAGPTKMEADGSDTCGGGEGAANLFRLGMCHLQGRGVAQDTARAVHFFQRASDAGDANAQFNLGVLYTQGLGVSQDHTQAARFFRLSAERGDAKAQLQLGVCFVLARGVPPSYEEAAAWFRAAAEQGDASAQYNLGVCLAKGRGVDKAPAEAVKWFAAAAEQGDAAAQFRLALAYASGRGALKDIGRAVEWYRRAAELGHGGALFNLGVCYAQGDGVVRDPGEAVEWYRRAADAGVMQAQHNLALALLTGTGCARDEAAAVRWYLRAAEQGDAKSQFAAGVCFEVGQGAEKDAGRAARLYKQAALLDNPKATVALGLCYKNGVGVARSAEKAALLFAKAANLGSHRGMYQYSRCLQSGEGLEAPVPSEAQEWLERAAVAGSQEAAKLLRAQERAAGHGAVDAPPAAPVLEAAPEAEARAASAGAEDLSCGHFGDETTAEGAEEEGSGTLPKEARGFAQAPPSRAPPPRPMRDPPAHDGWKTPSKVRCGLGSFLRRAGKK